MMLKRAIATTLVVAFPGTTSRRVRASKMAAAAGHAGAMNGLGLIYETGTRRLSRLRQGAAVVRKAVAGGNPYGMINLGRLYRDAGARRRTHGRARGLYEKAIASGNTNAMVSSGLAL